MSDNKKLKKAIRERMARTGEPYTTARQAVLDEELARKVSNALRKVFGWLDGDQP